MSEENVNENEVDQASSSNEDTAEDISNENPEISQPATEDTSSNQDDNTPATE